MKLRSFLAITIAVISLTACVVPTNTQRENNDYYGNRYEQESRYDRYDRQTNNDNYSVYLYDRNEEHRGYLDKNKGTFFVNINGERFDGNGNNNPLVAKSRNNRELECDYRMDRRGGFGNCRLSNGQRFKMEIR